MTWQDGDLKLHGEARPPRFPVGSMVTVHFTTAVMFEGGLGGMFFHPGQCALVLADEFDSVRVVLPCGRIGWMGPFRMEPVP